MRHPWGERNSWSRRGQARADSPGKAEGLTEGATETHPRAPGEPAQGPQEAQSRCRAQPVLPQLSRRLPCPPWGTRTLSSGGEGRPSCCSSAPDQFGFAGLSVLRALDPLGGPVRPLEHFSAKECSFRNAYSKIILGIKKLIIMNAVIKIVKKN